MFVRTTTKSLILFISLVVCAHGQNYQCALDLNNDLDVDDIGELEACLFASNDSYVCPIGATDCVTSEIESCPLGPSVPCNSGTCSVTETAQCEQLKGSLNVSVFRCPGTGATYSDSSNEAASRKCALECKRTVSRSCIKNNASYTCPISEALTCATNSLSPNIPQCSPNSCRDVSVQGSIETLKPVDSSMYLNDGERNADGACLGETRIFSGRAMSCRLPGAVSAYKNCCTDNKGKIYHDSKGNLVEATLTNKAITATAAAAWAAGSAFSTAVGAGATTTQAANAGSSAFVNSLQGAFDPTSLAIAVAIALIQTWLANACDQESMETAVLRASGYCFRVGTVCTSRWLGSCQQREEVNCCYNSKLARIVNEQGQSQLAGSTPFANTELDPNNLQALDCGGFTPEQFQALDFQRIDFTEYEADINTAVTDRLTEDSDKAVQRFLEK